MTRRIVSTLTRLAAVVAALSFGAPPLLAQSGIGGAKPAYLDKTLSDVPNAQAFVKRFWSPGLDDGETPQGLAVAGGRVHVVTYGAGGCHLHSLALSTGATVARLALPACKHGGGLAAIGGGRMVVADTHALFVVAGGAVVRRIALTGELRGSFADFDGRDLWIGSHVSSGPGKLWRLPLALLARDSLSEMDATATVSIPSRAQGLAFVRGQAWLTFSGSSTGRLARIDIRTGAEILSYSMPAGIEDIGLGPDGLLWAVSEAGAKKYLHWTTAYPLVFAIDLRNLR